VLESRKVTPPQLQSVFAIDAATPGKRRAGVVGALAWSGNWRITVEQTAYRQVRVTADQTRSTFATRSRRGDARYATLLFGFSTAGFGGPPAPSTALSARRSCPAAKTPGLRPVLYNSWEATTFNRERGGPDRTAEKAAKLGVELFVMDDGWFGNATTTAPAWATGS